MSSPRVWLVTGASSGFGLLITQLALSKGDTVVATCRRPPAASDPPSSHPLASLTATYPPTRLLIVKLDVTVPADIRSAFAQAIAAFGRVDVVFNNAGYGMLAEVEGTPEEEARRLFETNFWGATEVTREAARVMREGSQKGGRVLVVSSFTGIKPLPCSGYYSAAKHALEAVTDALAHEIDPAWNIKITIIEPGTFNTSALDNAARLPAPAAYTAPSVPAAQVRKALESLGTDGDAPKIGDPKKAAARIYELSELEDPPLRLALGKDARGYIAAQHESVKNDLAEYESWSEDLQVD